MFCKNVFINGGLGDFIATESVMSDLECLAVENIYWATRNRKFIQEAVPLKKLFPNLKQEIVVYDNWTEHGEGLSLINWKHELNFVLKLNYDLSWIQQELTDLGAPQIVREFHIGKRKFYKSRIAEFDYEFPAWLTLPEKFVLIHPWSDSLRTPARDFDNNDWKGVLGFLEKHKIKGVVINKSCEVPEPHPMLIDLSNKLSLPNVFAIAKKASYFMGSASFLHVLMPKLISHDRIFIKSQYPWLENSSFTQFKLYHAPVKDKSFQVYPSLEFLKDK